MMNSIKIGSIYEHFKGHKYKIIAIAKYSEDLSELVIYQNIETNDVWARPINMFYDKKEFNGKVVDRFRLIDLFS
jgi:hypothetical protein